MLEALAKVVLSYFLGGVMGGDLMRRILGGGDLRDTGSGNVGATNALRARGPSFAAGVLAIDAGKGIIAALLIPRIPVPWSEGHISLASLTYLCGAAAAVGHCFPVVHRFRGGKGVATLAGIFGALFPSALPWILGVFILMILVTGFVALASIGGAVAALVFVACFGEGFRSEATLFTLGMLSLVVFKHRSNLTNLFDGTEHRFERARLIGRQWDRWRAR